MKYILGNNQKASNIEMTAPVIQESDKEVAATVAVREYSGSWQEEKYKKNEIMIEVQR